MILFLGGALAGIVMTAGLVALAFTGFGGPAYYTDDPDERPGV